MPILLVRKGTALLREYSFPASVNLCIIGRSRTNDVVLPDATRRVSRAHAALVKMKSGEGYFVRDLGSLECTRVAGRAVHQCALKDGDVIEVGGYEVVFSSQQRSQDELLPIRVIDVSQQRGDQQKETAALTHHNMVLTGAAFSEPQRELLDQLRQEMRRKADFSQLLRTVTPAIAKITGASSGFVALLKPGPPAFFQVIARAGLRPGEQIDVLSADFLSRLGKGHVVTEEHALLVPLFRGEALIGFFCLARTDDDGRFPEQTVDFVVAFSNLAATYDAGPTLDKRTRGPDIVALEWGVPLLGRSQAMLTLLEQIESAAAGEVNVLVTGESGTGKELVARAIHGASEFSDGPFVAKNCAAIPEGLAESEIFGYAPKSGIANANPDGAAGWFELASQGTLFLDEIQGLDLPLQDIFLRVLQEREVWRIRGLRAVKVRLKVVAATDCDVSAAMGAGRFRPPLFYRFGVRLHICPLRERREDIPLLAHFFADQQAAHAAVPPVTFSRRALKALQAYEWPGNVRELENTIRRAVANAAGRNVLFSWDFEPAVQRFGISEGNEAYPVRSGYRPPLEAPVGRHVPRRMEDVEKDKIMEALEYCGGNLSQACRLLGYKSRQTMLNKMDRYGINRSYGDQT